jgi:hypothetical protein
MNRFFAVVVVLLAPGLATPALGQQPPGGTVKTFPYKTAAQADLEMHVHLPPGWKEADTRPSGWRSCSPMSGRACSALLPGRRQRRGIEAR